MTGPSPALLAKLVRSIALLALSYDAQVAWLESLGLGAPRFADELAMELEEGALLLRKFEAAGWISSETCQAVAALEDLLGERSGPENEEFWLLESLRDSPDWEQVRRMAIAALMAI